LDGFIGRFSLFEPAVDSAISHADRAFRAPAYTIAGMKSWFLRKTPGASVLERRETPTPEPGPGELRIRVRAAALNRGEFNLSPSFTLEEPRPTGGEASGIVDAVGEGVQGWKHGDRFMGSVRGACSDYALCDARQAMHAPARFTWEEAAAANITYMTAYDMLYPGGRLKAGEWLLVTGIASGVGVACLQIARMIGAKVIGTSGSAANLERLRGLGLDLGIPTREPDFAGAVLAATGGRGVDLIVNNVGGTVFSECIRSLAHFGRLAVVGYMDRTFSSEIDLNAVHFRRLQIFGVSFKGRPVEQRLESLDGFRREVLPAMADGRLRPLVDKVFAMDDLPAAEAYMKQDMHVGKIVVSQTGG
jgi:NADPH2:quinone reductase